QFSAITLADGDLQRIGVIADGHPDQLAAVAQEHDASRDRSPGAGIDVPRVLAVRVEVGVGGVVVEGAGLRERDQPIGARAVGVDAELGRLVAVEATLLLEGDARRRRGACGGGRIGVLGIGLGVRRRAHSMPV
ncbi:MAG: hypothetical protein ACK56I_23570, partial [bacterium]